MQTIAQRAIAYNPPNHYTYTSKQRSAAGAREVLHAVDDQTDNGQ
jgi:hypothetical protein